MAKNTDLNKANAAKKDEFYTALDVVSAEMRYHRKFFRDKIVLCNCDDPFESNFFKYFALNFNRLKLKKLIATCYKGSPVIATQLSWIPGKEASKELNSSAKRKAYKIVITEVPDVNGDGAIDITDVEWLIKHGNNVLTELEGDGDFRSEECIELLKSCDVVCSNPPFSLFREYMKQLIKYDKKFLIIGNVNAITYKEIFPLIKDNKLWMGASIHSGDREFRVPDDYPLNAASCRVDEDGNKYIRVKGVRWWTNIDYAARHDSIDLYKKYSPEEYPKYDNYDAIEVGKTMEIPRDYVPCWFDCPSEAECEWAKAEGLKKEAKALCDEPSSGDMGVPITFMDKHNPDQFEIVAADYEVAETVELPDGKHGSGRFYLREGLTPDSAIGDNLADRQTDRQTDSSRDCTVESSSVARCNGIMGVPITFFDRYDPDQFTIVGATESEGTGFSNGLWDESSKVAQPLVNKDRKYKRLFIRRRSEK